MNRLQDFVSESRAKPIPEVARGDGIYLWDTQGRRYLDGSAGAVVSNIGHNNTRVKEAMRAQADRVTFAYAKVWDSAAHRELAQKLTAMAGLGFDSVFLVSGGTEAVEASLKIVKQTAYARGARSRYKVISRTPSYHGSTLAILGVTGDPDFAEPFGGMFVPMPKVPAPLTYRLPAGVSAEEHARQCAQALEDQILAEGPDTVLAFILEPVGGVATGALVAPDVYYTMIRQICDRYGVFLIYDEVMSGAGRTGQFLAAHHWKDCRPDIVALAKGVSGGYAPLGAVLTTDDMVRDLRGMGGFFHGHTYAANPQACAAACAVLDELQDRRLVENAAATGPMLKQQLADLAGETEIIGDVRGRGLLLAVEIVADPATKKMFPPEADAIARIRARCMENGLILLARRVAGGRYGEWLMVCPPLIIDEAQIGELVGGFRKALLSFREEVARVTA